MTTGWVCHARFHNTQTKMVAGQPESNRTTVTQKMNHITINNVPITHKKAFREIRTLHKQYILDRQN